MKSKTRKERPGNRKTSGRSTAEPLPTIREVAEHAKVSLGTASRVINRNSTVAPEIRRRVEEAIRVLGYAPNRIAQSMRMRSTKAIGCLISDVRLTAAAEAVSGAERCFREAGYDLLLASAHNDLEQEDSILRLFRARQLDAIFTVISDDQDPARLEFLESLRLPIALLERDGGAQFDSVLTDFSIACGQACSHLIELGHERIGLIAGPMSTWPGREVRKGYTKAMTNAGLPVDESLVLPSYTFSVATCSLLLRPENGVTAVIGHVHDIVLLCKVAKGLGFQIPTDLSVVTIGDTDFLSCSTPAISAIKYDSERLGRTAAELLLGKLRREAPPDARRVVFPAEFVIRGTCVPPAAEAGEQMPTRARTRRPVRRA